MRSFILGLLALALLGSADAQQVNLRWIGPCGSVTTSPYCEYFVYRQDASGSTFVTDSQVSSYNDYNVSHDGSTHQYWVATYDPVYSPSISPISNIVTATMPLQAPPPTNQPAVLDNTMPTGSIIPAGSTTLSWANNPGQNVVGYDVFLFELQNTWVNTYWYQSSHGGALIPPGTTSAQVTVPQNGNMFHINLRTWYTDGSYGYSDAFYRETAPTGVPQILSPIQFTSQCNPNGTMTFTWSNGPSDTVNYYFHAGTGPGTWDLANVNVGLVNTYTTWLMAQGPRIVWVNISANSPSKGEVSGTYMIGFVTCHSIN